MKLCMLVLYSQDIVSVYRYIGCTHMDVYTCIYVCECIFLCVDKYIYMYTYIYTCVVCISYDLYI